MAGNQGQSGFGDKPRERPLRPEEILSLVQQPMLRWQDIPGGDSLAQHLIINPEDTHLGEIFSLTIQTQMGNALASRDPFWGNYPPAGTLGMASAGSIPLITMPNGDVLALPEGHENRGILVVGPSGAGKTTALRGNLISQLAGKPRSIVACDRKGDLLSCQALCQGGLPVIPLVLSDVAIALLQPVSPTRWKQHARIMVELLGSHLHLQASRRLLLDNLVRLYKRKRENGAWPTFSEWIESIENVRATAMSRVGQYREASLFALKGSIQHELGQTIDYTASDFFERLYSTPGLYVIDTSGISADAAALFASLFINAAYEMRGLTGHESELPISFVLDDAMRIAAGSTASEIEGGSPFATWAHMCRSRGIALIIAGQNYSVISPVIRNNVATVVATGAWGRDAEELGRDMQLTREQQAMLSKLQPGEAVVIARSVWPQAVYGRIPEVL